MHSFCRRSEGKTAAYFEGNVDVLANPKEDVLVYDTELWGVWKEVWDIFERDGVPRTEDLNTMQRYVVLQEALGAFASVLISL